MAKVKKSAAQEARIEDMLQDLISLIETTMEDAIKFDAGNNAAGKRIRKVIMEIPKKVKVIKAVSLKKEI